MTDLARRVERLEGRATAEDNPLLYASVEVRDPDADADELVREAWRERGYDEIPPVPPGQKFHTVVVHLSGSPEEGER